MSSGLPSPAASKALEAWTPARSTGEEGIKRAAASATAKPERRSRWYETEADAAPCRHRPSTQGQAQRPPAFPEEGSAACALPDSPALDLILAEDRMEAQSHCQSASRPPPAMSICGGSRCAPRASIPGRVPGQHHCRQVTCGPGPGARRGVPHRLLPLLSRKSSHATDSPKSTAISAPPLLP